MVAAIDWTNVIVTVVVGLPAIISAIYAGRIHSQIRTPSGKSLGEVVEYAHDTAIANNLLLSTANGPTIEGDRETLRAQGSTPPQVPNNPGGE